MRCSNARWRSAFPGCPPPNCCWRRKRPRASFRKSRASSGAISICKWFPEACLSHPRHKGFYTVKHFIEGESMPGAGVLNIARGAIACGDGKPMEGITPLQVAAALQEHAAATLKLVAELRPANTKELRLTLGDYEAMAHLGNYYAEKILGAAQLALYDTTGAARAQAGSDRAPDDGAGALEAVCRRGHGAIQAAVVQPGRQCGSECADGEGRAGYRAWPDWLAAGAVGVR